MSAMGTVKGGRVWDGVAVHGKVVKGLAKMGQVFYRRQALIEQGDAEIWYLDFANNIIMQKKPAPQDIRSQQMDWFDIYDNWSFNEAFSGFYQAGTLNVFEPHNPDWRAIESDGVTWMSQSVGWIDIWVDRSERPQFAGRQIRLFIDTRNGAPQNGDIWLEVKDA